jgi:hypothetical protein
MSQPTFKVHAVFDPKKQQQQPQTGVKFPSQPKPMPIGRIYK